MKTQIVLILFLLTGLLSIFTQLGIIFNNNALKYLAVSMYIVMIIYSLYMIIKYAKSIDWKVAIPLVLIIMLYPVFSIIFEVFQHFSFKAFTDGLLIKGGYYQLLLVGLAIAVISNRIDTYKVIYKYSMIAFPFGIFLVFLSFSQPVEIAMNIGFLALTNVFIPATLLAFYPLHKKGFILGWISLFMILFVSAYLGSRSYTLVGVYLGIATIFNLHKTKKKLAYKILFVAVVAYFGGAFSFLGETSELRGVSIVDRYQFDSLFLSLEKFLEDGNLMKLFFWEGNSRATILIDAFQNFTLTDWLFGRGINGTYISFVERSTIEMSWGQETFRWGLLYVVFLILIFIKSRKVLKKYAISLNNQFFGVLSIIVLVKLLDGFVYGMPELSIYNLLVFWAIMIPSIKKDKFPKKCK